jgi:hypothetical protein
MPRKSKSKWDLYEDGISYSALSKFVNDRERFRIRAVEGLAPGGSSEALEFGNVFHNLLEWYSSGVNSASVLQRRLSRYLRETGADSNSTKLANQAFEVFILYREYWDDKHMNFIEQEEKFRVSVPLSTGRSVPIVGRRDAIYRDTSPGQSGCLYLMENKTKAQIDHVWLESALPFNLQTMMYCYSIQRDYNEIPAGVLYNVIRRPGLRQKVKETDRDFQKRIREDISSRPEHYFVRHRVDFAPNDLNNFVDRVLQPLLEQVAVWWESIKHDPFDPWTLSDGSRNPHHFVRPFGIFDQLANGKGDYFDYVTRGSRVGLVEVDTLFPELVDD